ncbi:MAG: hypothetical protein ACOX8S_12220 [Christensenellales bacterium]|jgi:hypothetical protein
MKKAVVSLVVLCLVFLSACAAAPAITANDLLGARQEGYDQGVA